MEIRLNNAFFFSAPSFQPPIPRLCLDVFPVDRITRIVYRVAGKLGKQRILIFRPWKLINLKMLLCAITGNDREANVKHDVAMSIKDLGIPRFN